MKKRARRLGAVSAAMVDAVLAGPRDGVGGTI